MNDYNSWKAVFLLFLICIPAILTAQNPTNNPQAQQLLSKSNKSQFFIENKGQWSKQVKFLARLGGMNAWITDSGVVYDYYRIDRNYSPDSLMQMLPHEKDEFERTHTSCKGHVVRMDYNGINLNTEKQGIDKREAYYNYFIGNDSTKWASFVGLYGEVLVKDAYSGIDIRYYFDSGQIRYDYLVKPGADISQISFSLTGADALAVNENGELIIKTSLGEVKHGKLYAFQQYGNEKKEVSCRFERKEDGNFGVIATNYEKGVALVIDPLVFSTFLGTMSSIVVFSLDQNNNMILGGHTNSNLFPMTSGAYQTNYQGGTSDAFVTKLNSTGSSLIYSTFLGGSNWDYIGDIKVDTIGNTYLTGVAQSSNFPTTASAFQTTKNGNYDAFVLKLNPSGSALIYSTFLGGSGADQGNGLDVDANGFAYITGWTDSFNFPTTSGAFQTSHMGNYDAFVSKINQDGSGLIYSTRLGGSGQDFGNDIKVDNSGNAYIAGGGASSNYPTTSGAFQTTLKGSSDGYITKLNSQGTSLIFSTFLGGNNNDDCSNIVLMGNAGFTVTGRTGSTDFPTTSGAFKTTSTSYWHSYVSQFNSTGSSLTYSTYIGGASNRTVLSGIVIDLSGNKIITGSTQSSSYPTTTCAFQNTFGGGEDVFVSKLTPDLSTLLYSTFIGGTIGDYEESGIAIDTGNNVFIAGFTGSSNFPTTPGAYSTSILNSAAFALKLNMVPDTILATDSIIGGSFCAGSPVTVFFTGPCPINTGNVFSAQLSDGGGNFSNPITIGTLSSTASDSIICKIPKSTVYGTGYRIRVVSSSPSKIGTNNGCNLTINPSPNAAFSINYATQCLKENNFVFTNASQISSGSMTYNWNFGDTFTSMLTNIVHSYLNDSTFQVRLITSSNNSCSDTAYQTIITYPMPDAVFSIIDSTQCLWGNRYNFTNTSTIASGSMGYNWNFGDGNSSSNKNPSYSYSVPDTYAVLLICTSDKNCIDSFTGHTYIHVHPQPSAAFAINDSSQCLKRNNFDCVNNSTINSGTFLQKWQFGDGFDTVSYHTRHKYNMADSFWIKLLLISDWGCKDSILKKVIVNQDQTTSFNQSDSNVCVNESISFTNTSSNNTGTLSYLWDFGDGDTSHAINPQHSYKTDSTFTVLLITVNKFGCIDSANHKVTVFPLPTAGFTVDNNIQCLRDNKFKLTNNSIPVGSLVSLWDFGDGTFANSKDTSHIYLTADSFNVKLITTTLQGCKDSILKKVFVKPDQTTNFTVSDTSVCIGEQIQFNNSSLYNFGTLTFKWAFGDGNSLGSQNSQHTYSFDSIFDVKLVSINNFGCKDSISHKVYINPLPQTNFTINDSAQCLQGNSFTFTNNSSIKSGSIIQNYFDFGDGINSLLSPVTHTYLTVGNFLVKLVSKSDQGCSDSLNKTVYVRPMPIAGFAINSKTQNLAGNNFLFTSTSVIPIGNLKFFWDFGDGDTSGTSNPTHSYIAVGSYKVKIIATSDFGCADTFADSVFVLGYPKMHVSFSVQNACVGEEVLFKNTSTESLPDSFLNFLWDFGDGATIVKKEPKHIYAAAGKYTIHLSVLTVFGSKDSLTDTIEIFADPVVNIAATPDTIVIPGSPVTLTASGLYDQLLWFDNSTSNSISVKSEGTYWVTASYNNGCTSSDTILLTKVEIKKPELVNVITPNGDGINDYLTVRNIDLIKPCKLSIYNRWGDELFTASDYQNNWDGKYKGKSLPEETYYYVLVARDGKVLKGAVNILK